MAGNIACLGMLCAQCEPRNLSSPLHLNKSLFGENSGGSHYIIPHKTRQTFQKTLVMGFILY